MKLIETTTLYYQHGSSDKFYTISVVDNEDGTFSAPFTYGRRGTKGRSDYKAFNETRACAFNKYNKMINEKLAKGYHKGVSHQAPDVPVEGLKLRETASTVSTVETVKEQPEEPESSVQCQLLDEVSQDEALKLLADESFCAQEKHDGERRLIKYAYKIIAGFNRKGTSSKRMSTVYHDELISILENNGHYSCILDGEEVNGHYYIFDILELDGTDTKWLGYASRLSKLESLIPVDAQRIHLVFTAFTLQQKKELIERLIKENREGIVFKRIDAPYHPGHDTGDQFKFKFYATASCLVQDINQKRSVSLCVYKSGNKVSVGNCTIPPNKDIPAKGSIVEIKYLYAHEGGCLYQPIYLGIRDDIDVNSCSIDQLKYKPAA